MDDCWCLMRHQPLPCRPGLCSNAAQRLDPASNFNKCLNAVHPRVKFTREEEVDGTIAFLDIHITHLPNGHFSTCIYCKPSNTNIIYKPNSCQDPKIINSTFKGELCRVHCICSSPIQIQKEIDFTLNVFEDNGHDRQKLSTIAATYKPPPAGSKYQSIVPLPAPSSSSTGQPQQEAIPTNLFDVLPFNELDNGTQQVDTTASKQLTTTDIEAQQQCPFACILFIPGLSNQFKRTLHKAGCKTYYKSDTKLASILCSKTKTMTPKEQKKGVYKINCPCAPTSTYISQTS
jgi:hypothetical protein